MRIGVLALQGGFAAHARVLARLGHQPVEVRSPLSVESLDGLILPGGESSTQLELLDRLELVPALARLFAARKPILATCAGLILAARRVRPVQPCLGFLDVEVERNAYGRQIASAEKTSDSGRALVLIRAPRIVAVGSEVEVLDTLEGSPVLVRAGSVTAATYHPELAGDDTLHADVFPPPPIPHRDETEGRPSARGSANLPRSDEEEHGEDSPPPEARTPQAKEACSEGKVKATSAIRSSP